MNKKKLVELIHNLHKGQVIVIGDVMLDTYLFGDSTRISPEAPVPVVKIDETKQVLGGAGNVARSIAALGGRVKIFGITGEDNSALEMENLFRSENITPFLFSIPNRKTTIKTRVLARSQQMLRMDTETTGYLNPSEIKPMLDVLIKELEYAEFVVVSDYAKGLITHELMDFLRNYINKNNKKLKILADPKPENKPKYHDLYLLTPNAKESLELAQHPCHTLDEIAIVGQIIQNNLHLENLLTTLGPQGMALFETNNKMIHIPTMAKQVFDVTGAGDTVIATIALCLSIGGSLEEACSLANYAAGIVVGKIGSATASKNELLFMVEN